MHKRLLLCGSAIGRHEQPDLGFSLGPSAAAVAQVSDEMLVAHRGDAKPGGAHIVRFHERFDFGEKRIHNLHPYAGLNPHVNFGGLAVCERVTDPLLVALNRLLNMSCTTHREELVWARALISAQYALCLKSICT